MDDEPETQIGRIFALALGGKVALVEMVSVLYDFFWRDESDFSRWGWYMEGVYDTIAIIKNETFPSLDYFQGRAC